MNADSKKSEKHKKLMTLGQGLKVRISKCDDEVFKNGEIRVQFWTKRERLVRAFKMLGMSWGLALISVLIPGLHFILVPAFFFAGPIVAYFVFGQESAILGGQGICPHCEKFLPLVSGPFKFPFSDLCSECQTRVEINPQIN